MSDSNIMVPVIVGPTACGKSEFALRIAEEMDYEIISCDSRQIYKGMSIGTAKPDKAQLSSVHHYLVDIIEPSEEYSAYRFSSDASEIILKCTEKGKRVLICGGTGFYFRALSDGLEPQDQSDPQYRNELTKRGNLVGSSVLHEELKKADPVSAQKIHENDLHRIVRALAFYKQTGKPISSLKKEPGPSAKFDFRVIKLTLDRAELYKRINNRVLEMIKNGLWEEFSELVEKGFTESSPGMQCVGYRELFPVLRNEYNIESAIEKIQQNTRRYAKRQITWFLHQTGGIEFDRTKGYPAFRESFYNLFNEKQINPQAHI
jgi:tRNA dimethylallyltransferase